MIFSISLLLELVIMCLHFLAARIWGLYGEAFRGRTDCGCCLCLWVDQGKKWHYPRVSLGPLAGHRVRYEDRVPGGRGLRALFLDPKQQAAAEDSWGSGRRGSPRHPLSLQQSPETLLVLVWPSRLCLPVTLESKKPLSSFRERDLHEGSGRLLESCVQLCMYSILQPGPGASARRSSQASMLLTVCSLLHKCTNLHCLTELQQMLQKYWKRKVISTTSGEFFFLLLHWENIVCTVWTHKYLKQHNLVIWQGNQLSSSIAHKIIATSPGYTKKVLRKKQNYLWRSFPWEVAII